jgi:hypothetical protein
MLLLLAVFPRVAVEVHLFQLPLGPVCLRAVVRDNSPLVIFGWYEWLDLPAENLRGFLRLFGGVTRDFRQVIRGVLGG